MLLCLLGLSWLEVTEGPGQAGLSKVLLSAQVNEGDLRHSSVEAHDLVSLQLCCFSLN